MRGERDDRMRRARNSAFYAIANGITDGARQAWKKSARDMVREARELHRQALTVRTGRPQ
jgi:hypothetical protein